MGSIQEMGLRTGEIEGEQRFHRREKGNGLVRALQGDCILIISACLAVVEAGAGTMMVTVEILEVPVRCVLGVNALKGLHRGGGILGTVEGKDLYRDPNHRHLKAEGVLRPQRGLHQLTEL